MRTQLSQRHELTRLTLLVPVFALALASVGCQAWLQPVRGPEVVHNYQPSDLPVPLNFTFDETQSWAFIRFAEPPLEIRSGKFVYHGERSLGEVAHWYLDQMPDDGWVHESSQDREDILLRFRKNDERAVIKLERIIDDQDKFYVTRLTARILPK